MPSQKLPFPTLIVFISNTCIMILELVAGRIVAPYIGVSLYTWTGVIGVILAGISLGNYYGGKIADRWASRRTLGLLFILAGVFCFSVILILDRVAGRGIPALFAAMPIILRTLFIITTIFFFPSAVLGMISPVVVKLSLLDLTRSGETIGQIYAASAFGSILGTFATGFFLISWLGTRTIIIGTAAALIALGIGLGNWFRKPYFKIPLIAFALALPFLNPLQELAKNGPCLTETDYFCIKIIDQVGSDGKTYKALILDRLVHSFVDPEHPEKLEYNYERIYPEAVQYLANRKGDLQVLVIGGGGYSLPRFLEALYPRIETEVVEIDPGVTEVVHQHLGLSRSTRIKTVNVDGRMFLENLPADRKFDLIQLDAINDLSVPYHLTTLEYDRLMAKHLAPGGLLVVNLIDGRHLLFVSAYLRTILHVFPQAYLIPTNIKWQTEYRTTFVIIASQSLVDIEKLKSYDGGDGVRDVANWMTPQERVDWVLETFNPGMVLSDDYVPVDILLAPVFEDTESVNLE